MRGSNRGNEAGWCGWASTQMGEGMTLKLPEEVQILKHTVRRFVENEVDPLGDVIE